MRVATCLPRVLHVGVGIEVDGVRQVLSLYRILCCFIYILRPRPSAQHNQVGGILTNDFHDPLVVWLDCLAPILRDRLVVDLEDDVGKLAIFFGHLSKELGCFFFMLFRVVVVPINYHLKPNW